MRKFQISNFKFQIDTNSYWKLKIKNCKLEIPRHSEVGQALVTLLFFVVMGITITAAAAVIIVTNVHAASRVEEGAMTYYVAESGAEEGLLQLVRNPAYAGTETFSLNGGSAAVTVTQGNPITILSTGTFGNFVRKIQVQTVYNNGALTTQSWKEVN